MERRWCVDGRHYARTARHWLENLDCRRSEVLAVMADAYGTQQSRLWLRRWRIFFMACEELFAYDSGQEWFVVHYRLSKAGAILHMPLEETEKDPACSS